MHYKDSPSMSYGHLIKYLGEEVIMETLSYCQGKGGRNLVSGNAQED